MSQHTTDETAIDELVANTKLLVSDHKYRIQLDDLLSAETRTLFEALSAGDLQPHGSWSPREFARRVTLYEDSTERLARILGILGRWGDECELTDVLNILSFAQHKLGKPTSGLTAWLNLRLYPVVLLIAAYGIGLARAERWSTFHRLLSFPANRESQEPARIVDDLHLSAWNASDNQIWHTLDDTDRRKTPLSDHVCELMNDWSTSHLGIVASFEELFDMWDILASLVFSERYTDSHTEENRPNDTLGSWTPIGRAAWRFQSRQRILHRLQNDLNPVLLKAGFFNGDRDALKQAIQNVSAIADRHMW